MNRQEFALFASALRTYYSRENLLPNAQAMDLWFRALADIPYDSACVMLDKWVMLNKWSPSISEIREQCAEMTEEPRRDWSEGWADVLAAVRAFGWAREAEAIARLDPVTAETVRRRVRKPQHRESVIPDDLRDNGQAAAGGKAASAEPEKCDSRDRFESDWRET